MNARAKQLIEQARAADALDVRARERMLHGLTSKLARGQAPLPEIDAGPLLVPKASWLMKLASSFAGKVGLGVLGASLIAAGMLLLRREAPEPAIAAAPPPARVVSVPQPAPVPPATTTASRASTPSAEPRIERTKHNRRAVSSRGEAAAQPAASQPAPAFQAEPEAPSVPEPQERAAVPSPAQPQAPVTTLDDELALLGRAYSELNAGRAERAFEVLDTHAQRFPHGELEEAREVARMLALCAMGREPAARARANQFLATRPDSPFAGRVRSICPATKAP